VTAESSAVQVCDMGGTPDGCKRNIEKFKESKGIFRFHCEVGGSLGEDLVKCLGSLQKE